MIKNFKKLLLQLLRKWVNRLDQEFLEEQHNQRIEFVRTFLHEVLPNLVESYSGQTIIENATFNYFELPDGKLPFYHFTLPSIPLYVLVPNILSAEWSQVETKGISRVEWEIYQKNLTYMLEATAGLSSLNMASKPVVWLIDWNQPLNHFSLMERLTEITNA